MNRHWAYFRGRQMTSLIDSINMGASRPDSQRNNNDYAFGTASSHRSAPPILRTAFVISGYKGGSPAYTDAARRFDYYIDTWATLTASSSIMWLQFGCNIGRFMHQTGGYTSASQGTNKEYDPFADSYATLTSITARHGAQCFRYPTGANGSIAAGGSVAAGITATTIEYNRATDAEVSLGSMSVARTNAEGGPLGSVGVYANGYDGATGGNTNETRTYDRGTDAWTSKTAVGTAFREGLTGNEGTKNLWVAGYYVSSFSSSVYSYNAGADAWTSRNGATSALGSGPQAATFGGKFMMRGPSAATTLGITVDGYTFTTETQFAMADCTTALAYTWSSNML